ncbi:unnamed protein product [Urochloa humidicola]
MASLAPAGLTDDLIVEILSRLPVKSLCRCKCVSPHWHDLISHPDHRRRLPQTLAGFFGRDRRNSDGRRVWRFTNLFDARQPPVECDAPFSFMAGDDDVTVLDACNGLLLCRTPEGLAHQASRYAVCNPATKSWVALPASSSNQGGNDEDEDDEPPVGWRYIRPKLEPGVTRKALAVDVEGESWLVLPALEDVDDLTVYDPGFLGQYKGHLCYMNLCDDETHLSIWVLEDYNANEWVLKLRITIQELMEKICPPASKYFRLITVHPDCNWILYVCDGMQQEDTLMAYDMDLNETRIIQNLGSCSVLLPYVPLYAKSLTDGH